MSKYCIVTPDIDLILQQTLDPRSIWTMCQVNKHYNELWGHLGLEVAKTRLSLDKLIKKGYLWIFKWVFEQKYKDSMRVREIMDFHEYYKSATSYLLNEAKWTPHDEEITWDSTDRMYASESDDDEWFAQLHPKDPSDIIQLRREIIFYTRIQRLFDDALCNGHPHIAEYLFEIATMYLYKVDSDKSKLFEEVCSNGELSSAQWLIKLGENANDKIKLHGYKDSPFRYACGNGHIDVVRWIIELGETSYGKVNIHTCDEWALEFVCKKGYLEIFNYLIDLSNNSYGKFRIDDKAVQSLTDEYNSDRKKIFDYILSAGYYFDIHFEDEIMWRNNIIANTPWASVLLELGEKSHGLINIHAMDEHAFRILAKYSRTESIKELIKLGEGLYGPINIHADREAGFRHACRSGNLELAQYLIELGEGTYGTIDIHAVSDEAYHHAAQAKHTHILRYLESLSQTYGPIPDKIRKKYQNVK